MSMPTLYQVKNAKEEVIGELCSQVWSWFPLSRSNNKEEFDTEVGELIVTVLAVYCAGKEEGSPRPKFTLADVDSIESAGGKVPAREFTDCVNAFIHRQKTLLKYPDASDAHITYCTSAIEQAREALIQLEALKTVTPRATDKPKTPSP